MLHWFSRTQSRVCVQTVCKYVLLLLRCSLSDRSAATLNLLFLLKWPHQKLSQDSLAATNSTFCILSEWAISSSSLRMELYKNQSSVNFASIWRNLQIFEEIPYNFQWGNIPAFQLLCQTKTSLCHLPKRVSMCWYNRHVVVQNWRELG